MTLKVTEIFYSLQGETSTVGIPTVFIRLTGCPLRCGYCDTAYAFDGGTNMATIDILDKVKAYQAEYVTVTGGEPLTQPNCWPLLTQLCDSNYQVSLETSGAIDISQVDPRVLIVMDLKTPGSQEEQRNKWSNLTHLKQTDHLKFVICDRDDYLWAKKIIKEQYLENRFRILLSPSHGKIANQDLADWIIADRLQVRFQVQLHKYIWGDVRGK